MNHLYTVHLVNPVKKIEGKPKMKTSILIILSIITPILFAETHLTRGQILDALDIMKKNDQQRKAKTEQLELEMKLINKKGNIRVRRVTEMKKTDASGHEKSLIRFHAPADVKGTGLLTIEHADRDDNQWLYLPVMRKVRRISASSKSDNFVGTDFAYEDLKNEELEKYNYKLMKEEVLENHPCYVIKAVPATPKEKKQSGYSKREIWIDKMNFVNLQTKFYDKKGQLFKLFKASDIRVIEGTDKWRAHQMVMENLKTHHETTLLFTDFIINKGISDKNFTQRYLERGR